MLTCAAVNLATHYIAKNPAKPSELSDNPSKGSIICTASNAGIYPFPIAPIYAATKHAVVGLVRSLARKLEQEQIQINALAPAVIGELYHWDLRAIVELTADRNKHCS